MVVMGAEEQFCPGCEEYHATREETAYENYTYEGAMITLRVEKTVCAVCGEEIGSDEKDQEILDQIAAANEQYKNMLRRLA